MSQSQLGILIGGLIPALLFGFSGISQKFSSKFGISTGAYIVTVGIGVLLVGVSICLINREQVYNIKSIIPSALTGAFWGIGMMLVAVAISKYSAPLSKLAPLYNMNTLIAVIGALVIFSEWKDVNTVKVIIGSILIIAGGVLVSS